MSDIGIFYLLNIYLQRIILDLEKLTDAIIPHVTTKMEKELRESLINKLTSRKINYFILVLLIIVTAFRYLEFSNHGNAFSETNVLIRYLMYRSFRFSGGYQLVLSFFAITMGHIHFYLYMIFIGNIIYWSYITLKFIYDFPQYIEDIDLYHPDSRAGFSGIADLLYLFVKLVVLLIIFVILGDLKDQYVANVHEAAFKYAIIPLVAFLLIFIIPQVKFHNIILKAKKEKLIKFQEAIMKADKEITDTRINNFDDILSRVQVIQLLKSEINMISNYPFNLKDIIKTISTIISPVFLILLSIYIERYIII